MPVLHQHLPIAEANFNDWTRSKMACQVDGKKPTMILSASAASSSGLSRKKLYSDSESELDMSLSSIDGLSDNACVSASESDTDNEVDDSIKMLRSTWASVGVDHKEEDLIGKWYGVIYRCKKKMILYVAKLKNRFLEDVDGPVSSLLMECLMPKIGSENELRATPTHLPPDISKFH